MLFSLFHQKKKNLLKLKKAKAEKCNTITNLALVSRYVSAQNLLQASSCAVSDEF